MDFAFTDEQEMLRASVRQLLAERYPIDRVAKIADGDGFDRAEWPAVAEAGWLGISLAENVGGAGLSFLDELIVAEELGQGLYPGPWFSTAILALGALSIGGEPTLIEEVITGSRIATLAWAGEDGRFTWDPPSKVEWDDHDDLLTATKLFVPHLGVADLVIVIGGFSQGVGIWAVDRDAVGDRWRELPTVDATRPMGEVVLERAPATLLVDGELTKALMALRDRALAALAVEAVGVASRALEHGLEYARDRTQFGRPIGSFQAVSHPLAQAFLEVETARSLAYWAGWAVAEGDPDAARAASAAKARAADAAVTTCERAIQVHGGVGFTWEHPLHRLYKRALGISAFMGWGGELRARVAADLLDEPQ
jgi:alkylation response protein AidB-like acyl-CoA dehydrogenase